MASTNDTPSPSWAQTSKKSFEKLFTPGHPKMTPLSLRRRSNPHDRNWPSQSRRPTCGYSVNRTISHPLDLSSTCVFGHSRIYDPTQKRALYLVNAQIPRIPEVSSLAYLRWMMRFSCRTIRQHRHTSFVTCAETDHLSKKTLRGQADW